MIRDNPLNVFEIGEDLENWMTNLPVNLKNIPIVYLAIPGSHDSGSYSITVSSPIAPDTLPSIQHLSKLCGPLVKRFVYNWVVTQNVSIMEQLKEGIRYLDLRVATKSSSRDIFFVHGLYGDVINKLLLQVKSFLESHPGEIIVLDFQHFYAFTSEDHYNMVHLIESMFGSRLCPIIQNLRNVTLNWMQHKGYQIIVIYRNPVYVPLFWPPNSWLTPWPDTTDVNTMFDFLNHRMARRPDNAGYVSQCVLTPDASFILRHPFSTLESRCAVPCNEAVVTWLEKQKPGPGGINVVISDFIKMPKFPFCKTVICLNSKLLNNTNHKMDKA